MIGKAFPPSTYYGPITAVDGHWAPELDEEKGLFEALAGRDWTQVTESTINKYPNGFVLLTEKAFAAFLPAWVMRALNETAEVNEVRELLIYSLSGPTVGPSVYHMGHRLQNLSADQRAALRTVMESFAKGERNEFIRNQAGKAVDFVDSISGEFLDGRIS